MFYIIYIAVIVFALYLIFHDRPEGDGERRREQKRPRSTYRPESPGRVPQVPYPSESPMPKPLEPAKPIDPVRPVVRPVTPVEPAKPVRTYDPFRPAGPERELSWGYLSAAGAWGRIWTRCGRRSRGCGIIVRWRTWGR